MARALLVLAVVLSIAATIAEHRLGWIPSTEGSSRAQAGPIFLFWLVNLFVAGFAVLAGYILVTSFTGTNLDDD